MAAGECAGGWPPDARGASPLDPAGVMTDNSRDARRDRRLIGLEAKDAEIESLRASRRRLVRAADADRRRIERDLHNGVQQHLVALAVNVQLAGRLADTDPAAAKTLLEQLERDVQETLDATAQLAQRIYPPLLEPRGLAAVLRSAAAAAGVAASVNVAAGLQATHRRTRRRSIRAGRRRSRPSTPNERRSPSGTTVRPSTSRSVARGGQARSRARAAARPRRGARRPAHDHDGARPPRSASPARSRSRNDASRSAPGRGSRPSRAC